METVVTAADSVAVSRETNQSGVSWSAIFAGAAAAAALSYVLVILGFGLGLSSVSPWANDGAGSQTIGVATILWLAFTQIVAAGMGGYLAGRLRVKWAYVADDEIYFRDTAHGFLSWAIASLVVVAFLATAVGNVLGSGAKLAGSALSGAGNAVGASVSAAVESTDMDTSYFVDTLFRGIAPTPASPATVPAPSTGTTVEAPNQNESIAERPRNDVRGSNVTPSGEVSRIFTNAIRTGGLSESDRAYLAQMVAARTGLSADEAQQRVEAGFNNLKQGVDAAKTKAKEVADAARKAAALLALWLFVSLLCGAFTASLMAIFGGRSRDAASIMTTRYAR